MLKGTITVHKHDSDLDQLFPVPNH